MAASSVPLFPLAGRAALLVLAALVASPADGAALVSSESQLIGGGGGGGESPPPAPSRARAKRQLTRYGEDTSVAEDDWETRARQAVNSYQNAVNRGWLPQDRSEEQDAARTNNNNNRNQQGTSGTSWSGSQQGRGRTRTSGSSAARQTSNGYRPGSATSSPADQGYGADPWTRSSWGDADGGLGNNYGGGGGGLFGNRPSIIGGLIRRLGQGFANTVQGVSSALANKWSTKAQAARAFASSLLNTGRVGINSGLQAGLAHPRFAVEAMENVF